MRSPCGYTLVDLRVAREYLRAALLALEPHGRGTGTHTRIRRLLDRVERTVDDIESSGPRTIGGAR